MAVQGIEVAIVKLFIQEQFASKPYGVLAGALPIGALSEPRIIIKPAARLMRRDADNRINAAVRCYDLVIVTLEGVAARG
jgi:hypothetical protein